MSLAEQIYTPNGLKLGNSFPGKLVVHLGCGNQKIAGATGVDVLSLPEVDIVHNLDVYPWPLAESSADIVFCHSAAEHVQDMVGFMDEIWRISKPEAKIIITVPYFRSVDSFTDITHKHFFTSASLNYFIDDKSSLANYQYTNRRYLLDGFWYGWPGVSSNPLVRVFKRFILKHKHLYDQYLSLFLPMKILIWELSVKK